MSRQVKAAIWAAVALVAAGSIAAAWQGAWPAMILCMAALLVGAWAARGAWLPTRPADAQAQNSSLGALAPLIEALPEPALLVDGEGRVAGSNAGARDKLKFEASGLRLSAILRQPQLLDAVQAATVDGAPQTVEYESLVETEEHVRAYVTPIAWQAQAGALVAFHDRTAAIATERMRADFLANASHELRTPVASLSLLIDTLLGHARGDVEAQDRFLGMMKAQVTRMGRLVDDLLSLSRIELNERVPPTERAELSDVVRETLDTVSAIAAERGVAIAPALSDAPLIVTGDRFQLAQVAQNLIDNAIKHSPAGGRIEVETGVGPTRDAVVALAGRRWPQAAQVALLTAPPGGARYAYLRVADAGPGIARRHLPRLSERFYRPDQSDGAQRRGTGLGLAIVRHIMNRHRGGMLVESQPGLGSAFAIYLELAEDQPAAH